MINYNGIFILTIEELEAAMINESETVKTYLRNEFNNTVTPTQNAVPVSVTPRQIRLALVLSGVGTAGIESAIDNLTEPTKSAARIAWEYSTEFQRYNPLILQLAPAIGLSSEQIDTLFRLAATL